MKRIVILAFATFAFTAAQAQVSGGLRTGASLWTDKGKGSCSLDGQNKTWDQELFARYKTKGKIVLEAGVGHYSYKRSSNETSYMQYFVGQGGYINRQLNERSQNIELNLSAQCDVSCPAMKSCKLMKNLSSFIGIVVTPTISYTTSDLHSTNLNDGKTYTTSSSERDFLLWTGLTHTLLYSFTPNLYLTSAVRLQIEPNKFFDNSGIAQNYDTRFGMQVGLGYNFN